MRGWFWRRREVDLDDEIRAHLALAARDRIDRGESSSDAEQAARREFGNVALVKEVTRDMWGWMTLDRIFQDLRQALRMCRRNPGFTTATVVTFAVGIGASSAIFAITQGVLLRPLPYDDPDGVVLIWSARKDGTEPERGQATPRRLALLRTQTTSFSDVGSISLERMDVVTSPTVERVSGAFASPNAFRIIGVRAWLGRTFVGTDGTDGIDRVVLSHRFWHRQFGGDPTVVGRTIQVMAGRGLRRRLHMATVVGVLPPRVQWMYPEGVELWMPVAWQSIERLAQDGIYGQAIARLRPDASFEQAQAAMSTLYGPKDLRTIWLERAQDFSVGRSRPAFMLLGAVTAFLLLVACVNVASLLLARTAERSRELALRAALGAGRGRLTGQLLSEGLVLAGLGGVIGVTLIAMLAPVLRQTLPVAFPRVNEVAVDGTTILWAVLLTAGVGLGAGLLPSWRGIGNSLSVSLKSGGPFASGTAAVARWRRALTAAQVAIVTILLVCGGLLLRSFWNLQRADIGFDGADVLTMQLRILDLSHYDEKKPEIYDNWLRSFHDDLLARVRAVPGVVQASVTTSVPFRGTDWMYRLLTPAGGTNVALRGVDAEYFSLMRIGLISGRLFDRSDTSSSPRVALVSESLARMKFGEENPIGKLIDQRDTGAGLQIVGVVRDVHHRRVDEAPVAAIYVPKDQRPDELMCLVVRTKPQMDGVAAAVRAAVQSVDPRQPIEAVTTLDQIVADSISDRRFYGVATAAFAMVGLVLAIAGLYGVVTRGVIERTREFGIRLALGAERIAVLRLVLRQALVPVAVGLATGALMSTWIAMALARFLFGLSTIDPITFAIVPIVVILLAALACAVPARRACRVNPVEALRAE